MDCPNPTLIALFVDQRLDGGQASDVERHVDSCVTCRHVLSGLARTAPQLGAEDRYVVVRELARGGMGKVSIAQDTLLGRTVALKELLVPSPALEARFQRELALTARLQHPAIVSIHDAGAWPNGEPFYVMRLVTGNSLEKLISDEPRATARMGLLPYAIAMIDAIAYAHSHEIIHRDLKPANVLVGNFGETVVIDWGLAKDLASDAEPGEVAGTPAYMAPEQARGEQLDQRTDVYALGAVLYHLLAGEPPYRGRSPDEILEAVKAGTPKRLRELPPDLTTIVEKALAREPAERYANAGELSSDLKRFQLGQLVGAHRYSRRQLFARWLARHRVAVSVGAIAVGVLAIVATVSIRRVLVEQRTAERNRGDAEELMTYMLTDLNDKLRPIGKLDLLGDVAEKARAYYRRRPYEDTAAARYKQELAHANLANVLQYQGDNAGARAEYALALGLVETLAKDEPEQALWQHELSDLHRRLGELDEQSGKPGDASSEYRAARSLDEAAVARDASVLARSDLLQTRLGLGRVASATGDSKVALHEFRAALELAAPLAADPAAKPVQRRLLYLTHNYIGEQLEAQGEIAAAAKEYIAAQQLATERTKAHPDDAEAQRDLYLADVQLGKLAIARGDSPRGMVQLRAAVEIAETLAARDPANIVWQRDLSVSLNEVGNVQLASGDTAGALVTFRAGQRVIQRIGALAPSNVDVKRDMQISASRVGEALDQTGDHAAALVEYRARLAMANEVAQLGPTSSTAQSDLAMAHSDLGGALQTAGEKAGALAEFRAGDELAKQLLAKDPANAMMKRQRWAFLANISELTPDAVRAIADLREGSALVQQLSESEPTDLEVRGDYALSRIRIGALLAGAEAVAENQAGIAICRDLVAKDPTNKRWADQLATAIAQLARVEK